MAELLDFVWTRRVDGYSLERLDPKLLTYVHDAETDIWFLVKIDPAAPNWVHDLLKKNELYYTEIKDFFDDYPYGDKYLIAISRRIERYRPLEIFPALFMELAGTEPTPNGAARFINRYGLPHSATDTGIGTPADLWAVLSDSKAMKSGIRAWERLRETGDVKSLVRRVEGKLRRAAHLSVELRAVEGQSVPSMVLVPHTLLDAIWLQFAQAVAANHDFRRCDECLKWFEIAPGKGRPEKRFCSNACSMRAYRKRRAAKPPRRRG